MTAATLDSDDNVAGRFELKTAVGELGVPLSPDSLVLPKEASALPKPPARRGARPARQGVGGGDRAARRRCRRTSRASRKQIVLDRAVEVAEAGFRVALHEPLRDSATQLAMDFLGSDFARLPRCSTRSRRPRRSRRTTTSGSTTCAAIGSRRRLRAGGRRSAARPISPARRRGVPPRLAEKTVVSARHIVGARRRRPARCRSRCTLVDAQGRRVGGIDASGKIVKEIPFSDFLTSANASGAVDRRSWRSWRAGSRATTRSPRARRRRTRQCAVRPQRRGAATPTARLRHVVFEDLTPRIGAGRSRSGPGADRFTIDLRRRAAGPAHAAPSADADRRSGAVAVGVVQQEDADSPALRRTIRPTPGRIIAVLFSEEVTAASVQDRLAAGDITQLRRRRQQGRRRRAAARTAASRSSRCAIRIGPFVPRQLTIARRRRSPRPARWQRRRCRSRPRSTDARRRRLRPRASMPTARRWRSRTCGSSTYMSCGASRVDRHQLEERRRRGPLLVGLRAATRCPIASSPSIPRPRSSATSVHVQRDGQRLNVDIVLLGRGTFNGRTLGENGTPLANTERPGHQPDRQSQYGATTDADGRFTHRRHPGRQRLRRGGQRRANAQVIRQREHPVRRRAR